jgi:hypothetical protein
LNRTMFQFLGYKDQTTFCQGMSFIPQPYIDLSTQIVWTNHTNHTLPYRLAVRLPRRTSVIWWPILLLMYRDRSSGKHTLSTVATFKGLCYSYWKALYRLL